jgi:hypothetical protein
VRFGQCPFFNLQLVLGLDKNIDDRRCETKETKYQAKQQKCRFKNTQSGQNSKNQRQITCETIHAANIGILAFTENENSVKFIRYYSKKSCSFTYYFLRYPEPKALLEKGKRYFYFR